LWNDDTIDDWQHRDIWGDLHPEILNWLIQQAPGNFGRRDVSQTEMVDHSLPYFVCILNL
jgi:hypothetical protein